MLDVNNNYHLLKLYYPSKDKENKPLNQAIANPLYKHLIKDIVEITQGLTVYPSIGYYMSSQGMIIDENISIITVYTDKLELIQGLMQFYAKQMLDVLNQESIMIESDNIPSFITGKDNLDV